MADAIAGREGRITINGTTMYAEKFTVRADATKLAANDFETAFRKNKAGLKGAEVSVSGYYDRDNNPPVALGIKVGEVLSNVLAYLIKGGLVFTFTELRVFSVEVGSEADGRVDFSFTGDTNGTWSYPGGVT